MIGDPHVVTRILAIPALTKLVFLDTNILMYAADRGGQEVEKAKIAREIIRQEDYCTSGQVLAEFFYNVTRKGTHVMSSALALGWVRQIALKPCQAIDSQLVEAAIGLSTRNQISYWDGAIIAAAERLGARLLYTEDLNHNQIYGTVTARNPFLS